MTILQALRLAQKDPAEQVLASYPDATADDKKAADWTETWNRNWERRFV